MDCPINAEDLPARALKAFMELQRALTTEQVLAHLRRGRQYALTTDVSVVEDY